MFRLLQLFRAARRKWRIGSCSKVTFHGFIESDTTDTIEGVVESIAKERGREREAEIKGSNKSAISIPFDLLRSSMEDDIKNNCAVV